ncbi:MAG: OmpA family protein [Nitrosomonadales bacterium]|nr:OmpA family protein [Nitrosomonadales bacterium]
MSHTWSNSTAALIARILAAALFIATSAQAGDSPSEINQRIATGDPVAGKDKSAVCQGCHGEDGNSMVPTFPKLAGQWAGYIQKQFREFQNGARNDATMSDVAQSVNEFPELFDIAAYFSSQKQMAPTPIEDEAGQKLYYEGEKLYTLGNADSGAFRCVKCHGEHGSGEPLNNNLFPVLGGQHKDYLVKQLTDFKKGDRDNDRSGMMMLIAGRLTEGEIEALATYLSGSLVVAPPPPPPAPAPPPPPPPAPVKEKWQILLEDKPISIEGTSFDSGKAKLKKSASQQLDIIVDFARNRPEAKLDVIGYTDITGSEKKNMQLSLDRAVSVKKYLIDKGVAAERINTQGLGPANPVADNATKEGRAKNRRVEIRSVLKEEKKVRLTE